MYTTESRACPRCIGGRLMWDELEQRPTCVNCGYYPRILSIGEVLARQERPTGKHYKRGSHAPRTPRYD